MIKFNRYITEHFLSLSYVNSVHIYDDFCILEMFNGQYKVIKHGCYYEKFCNANDYELEEIRECLDFDLALS